MFRVLDCSTKRVMVVALALFVLAGGAHAAGFKVLHSFQGGADGFGPPAA